LKNGRLHDFLGLAKEFIDEFSLREFFRGSYTLVNAIPVLGMDCFACRDFCSFSVVKEKKNNWGFFRSLSVSEVKVDFCHGYYFETKIGSNFNWGTLWGTLFPYFI
jgi:hypothetical protein